MSDTNEPMSDEHLAYIRRGLEIGAYESYVARVTIAELYTEVVRLRAALEQEQREHGNCEDFHFRTSQAQTQVMVALAEQNAAMRPIVESVVAYATLKRYMDACEWCGQIGQSVDAHAPDCPVTQARAYLAAHPAGEAVSRDDE